MWFACKLKIVLATCGISSRKEWQAWSQLETSYIFLNFHNLTLFFFHTACTFRTYFMTEIISFNGRWDVSRCWKSDLLRGTFWFCSLLQNSSSVLFCSSVHPFLHHFLHYLDMLVNRSQRLSKLVMMCLKIVPGWCWEALTEYWNNGRTLCRYRNYKYGNVTYKVSCVY